MMPLFRHNYSAVVSASMLIGTSFWLLAGENPILAAVPPLLIVSALIFFKYPIGGFYLLILLIPCQAWESVSSTFQFLSLSKFIGIWIFLIILSRMAAYPGKTAELKSWVWFLLFIFLAIHLVSFTCSQYPAIGLNTIRRFITALLFVFTSVYFIRTRQQLNTVAVLLVAGISAAAFAGIAAKLMNFESFFILTGSAIMEQRLTGTTSSPNYFGMLIIASLPLIAYFYFHARRRPLKMLYIFLFAQNIYAIILTYSRASYLIFIIVALLIVLENRSRFQFKHLGLVILLALISVGYASVTLPETIAWKRFSTITEPQSDVSIARRASYIAVSWEAFKENPVLGSGPGAFPIIYSQSHIAAAFAATAADYTRLAHNTYLEILTGTGSLGLICYLLILFVCLKKLYHSQHHLRTSSPELSALLRAFVYVFLSILLFQLFLSVFFVKYIWLLIAIGIVSDSLLMHQERNNTKPSYIAEYP